jgi:hypothetical protein
VRPGLLAVGAALAIVGAAVIVVLVAPSDVPPSTHTGSWNEQDLPQSPQTYFFPAMSSGSAVLSVTWSLGIQPTELASSSVSWYAATACSTGTDWCPDGPALVNWTNDTSGVWSDSGSSGPMFELSVDAVGRGGTPVDLAATFSEQYRTTDRPLPMVPFLLVMSGGALLAGIGAVAVYLGLFLPPGLYPRPELREPPEEPPR